MLVKILALGLKRIDRAALRGVADDRQRRRRLAQVVFLPVHLAVAADGQLQVVGQRIDDRHADAVQAAGDLVRAVVEFTAGVQHGHDDFGRGAALFRVDIDRNAAAVVRDGDGLIGVDRDDDPIAMTGQRLVDGVVDDLENHVVQAGAVIGVADVHSGAFAHRVKTL